MGHGGKEGFSSFKFYSALDSTVTTEATFATGNEIDMIGYETATIVINVGSFASAAANDGDDCPKFVLLHGLASLVGTEGASVYSLVPGSQLIHSTYGGHACTASTGRFWTFLSKTSLGGLTGVSGCGINVIRYKKDPDHRYLRLYMSISGNHSAMWVGAIAILGEPANWPVNDAIN